jgi:hypothetical protein
MVWAKITCGLWSGALEEYTACVSRMLSEDVGSMFILNSIHTGLFGFYVWKYRILALIGLKWYHKMEGGWGLLWNSSFGCIISHTTVYSK